jgi:hypothetical protein
MTIVQLAVAVAPIASVTVTAKGNVSAVDGVPAIAPVVELGDRPSGRLPLVNLYV